MDVVKSLNPLAPVVRASVNDVVLQSETRFSSILQELPNFADLCPNKKQCGPGKVCDCYEVNEFLGQERYLPLEPQNTTMVLVFQAKYCQPCSEMAPLIHGLAFAYPGVRFVRVDIVKHPQISKRFAVETLPQYVMLQHGRERGRVMVPDIAEVQLMVERGLMGIH
jgi:thiol-disulfide isomerase/thioredoxin